MVFRMAKDSALTDSLYPESDRDNLRGDRNSKYDGTFEVTEVSQVDSKEGKS